MEWQRFLSIVYKGVLLDLQGVRERVLRIGNVVPVVGNVRGAKTAWLKVYADFFEIPVTFDFFLDYYLSTT